MLAACFALAAIACARAAPTTAPADRSTCRPVRAPIGEPAPDGTPGSPRAWLTIKRDGCLGACPVYRAEVDESGALWFRPVIYTAARGEHRRRLAAHERAEVERALARLHCLPDFDGVGATDSSRVIITYTLGGRRFRYEHDGSDSSAPPEARRLELALEAALGIERWAARDPSWDSELRAAAEEWEARERERVRALEESPLYQEADDTQGPGG